MSVSVPGDPDGVGVGEGVPPVPDVGSDVGSLVGSLVGSDVGVGVGVTVGVGVAVDVGVGVGVTVGVGVGVAVAVGVGVGVTVGVGVGPPLPFTGMVWVSLPRTVSSGLAVTVFTSSLPAMSALDTI
jgi:hypothetical protein